jgi:predicted outer membrane repeat protein
LIAVCAFICHALVFREFFLMVHHHNKGIISHWINLFLCALFVALPFSSVSAQSSTKIIYVNQAASGAINGSSWANAYTRLELALAAAQANDQIWIAKGIYRPTSTTNREASFVLKDQVKLYGGFAGTETSLNQRNITTHKTILSGDIDQNDTHTDGLVLDPAHLIGNNSYHVVTANNLQQGVLLDGLYITAGLANFESASTHMHHHGAAIYSLNSKLVIQSSYLLGNKALGLNARGAAVYLDQGHVSINASTIQYNEAPYGAVYNFTGQLTFEDSLVDRNTGTAYGGAIYSWKGSIVANNTQFTNNQAWEGGVLYAADGSMEFNNVQFNQNTARVQGGAIVNSAANIVINHSSFDANSVSWYGGAIYNRSATMSLLNTHFSNNLADLRGGAINNEKSTVTINGGSFQSNGDTLSTTGGAIYNSNQTELSIRDTLFSQNNAKHGGAISSIQSTVDLTNLSLVQNKASGQGGALWNSDTNAVLTNVEIIANVAESGAAIYNDNASPQLRNLTIAANYATSTSAIHNINAAEPLIQNTVIWANHPKGLSYDASSSSISSYSLLQGCNFSALASSCGANAGNNLVPVDPQFVSAGSATNPPSALGDYRLKNSSPLIDQGDSAVNSEELDITGKPRKTGLHIDIGAHEQQNFLVDIVVQPAGKGSVQLSPAQQVYTYTQQISLNAQANPGWAFDGWLGDIDANPNTPNRTLQVVKNHTITAKFRNLPPTANAGADQTVGLKSQVTLDASASADADPSQTLSYKWTQTAGPSVTLSSATAAKPTFTAPNSATTLTFSVEVSDNLGAVSSASVKVTVTTPPVTNQAPIANAGPDQQVQINTTVTLDGSASRDPNPGQTLTYKWTQTAGPSVTLSNATTAKPTFTAPNSATILTFSLVVTDNFGAISSADTVNIRVLAPGQAPSYPVYLPFVRR